MTKEIASIFTSISSNSQISIEFINEIYGLLSNDYELYFYINLKNLDNDLVSLLNIDKERLRDIHSFAIYKQNLQKRLYFIEDSSEYLIPHIYSKYYPGILYCGDIRLFNLFLGRFSHTTSSNDIKDFLSKSLDIQLGISDKKLNNFNYYKNKLKAVEDFGSFYEKNWDVSIYSSFFFPEIDVTRYSHFIFLRSIKEANILEFDTSLKSKVSVFFDSEMKKSNKELWRECFRAELKGAFEKNSVNQENSDSDVELLLEKLNKSLLNDLFDLQLDFKTGELWSDG